MKGQFHTPKSDELVKLLAEEIANGNIAESTAQRIGAYVVDATAETAAIVNDIFEKAEYRKIWLGFGLGIIATIVVAAVVVAAYFNFN